MIVGVGHPVFDLIEAPGGSSTERVLSGCSVNACVAVAKLGGSAAVVGRVGEAFRQRLDDALAGYGVDGRLEPAAETAGFRVVYSEGGRRLYVLGVAEPIATFPRDLLAASAVLFGPILGETPLELLRDVRRGSDALLMLDPQGFLRRVGDGRVEVHRDPAVDAALALVDVVKASADEAAVITGMDAAERPRRAVRELRSLMSLPSRGRPRIAIVTLAEKGSVIDDGVDLHEIPAFSTVALDPTGAGDAYAGGFLFEYLKSLNAVGAGAFASAVASTMVETVGGDLPVTLSRARRRATTLMRRG